MNTAFPHADPMQDSQQWLGRLIPDKQNLSDQLKNVQQNSVHRESTLRIK